jgi:hypothetical protein
MLDISVVGEVNTLDYCNMAESQSYQRTGRCIMDKTYLVAIDDKHSAVVKAVYTQVREGYLSFFDVDSERLACFAPECWRNFVEQSVPDIEKVS